MNQKLKRVVNKCQLRHTSSLLFYYVRAIYSILLRKKLHKKLRYAVDHKLHLFIEFYDKKTINITHNFEYGKPTFFGKRFVLGLCPFFSLTK